MKCPVCKEPMKWKEGLLDSSGGKDHTAGRYYCVPCRVSGKPQDGRAIKEGRKRAKEFEGIPALDKRMLALPCMVQLGILRERQKNYVRDKNIINAGRRKGN
jgi:hypothetical protein